MLPVKKLQMSKAHAAFFMIFSKACYDMQDESDTTAAISVDILQYTNRPLY